MLLHRRLTVDNVMRSTRPPIPKGLNCVFYDYMLIKRVLQVCLVCDGHAAATHSLLPQLARVAHDVTHTRAKAEISCNNLTITSFSNITRQQHDPGKPGQTISAAHHPAWGPFVNMQTDFEQLQKCLVIVVLLY